MDDIFAEEQKILDSGYLYLEEVKNGAPFDLDKHEALLKEYRRLLRQLRRITKMADKVTNNLHENNLDLNDKVHYDTLTGIYNRRFLESNMKRIIASMSREGGGLLSVLLLDIDFFKKYNDTYGHSEGDACLKAVSQALASCILRPDDFVARYGGEEFAVILPNTDENGARMMSKKILEAVRSCNIPHEKNEAASCVTISIGATTGEVDHGQTNDDYIRSADEALYHSKHHGRDRYTYTDF